MPKKRGPTEHEYRAYRRKHDFANPSDIEKGKIHRETLKYTRYNAESDKVSRQIPRDPDNEALADRLDELDFAAAKNRRNSRTHKDLLKALQRARRL